MLVVSQTFLGLVKDEEGDRIRSQHWADSRGCALALQHENANEEQGTHFTSKLHQVWQSIPVILRSGCGGRFAEETVSWQRIDSVIQPMHSALEYMTLFVRAASSAAASTQPSHRFMSPTSEDLHLFMPPRCLNTAPSPSSHARTNRSPSPSPIGCSRFLPPALEDMHLLNPPPHHNPAPSHSPRGSSRDLHPSPADIQLFVRPRPTQRK